MLIEVRGPLPEVAVHLRRELPEGTHVVHSADLLGSLDPSAAVVVLVQGTYTPGQVSAALSQMRRGGSAHTPTVLVTPFTRAVSQEIAHYAVADIVWLDEYRDVLTSRVSACLNPRATLRMQQLLLGRLGNDPLLSRAVRAVCDDSSPPRTVAELASGLGCSAMTLRRRWTSSRLPESPRALLDWALVCRAASMRNDDRKLVSIAIRLGVDETTLYRVSRRRVGRSAGRLHIDAVWSALQRWID